MDYKVVGSAVNLASHLESIANPDEILITENTYNLVKNQVNCSVIHSAKSEWLSRELKFDSVNKMASGLDHCTDHSKLIDNL